MAFDRNIELRIDGETALYVQVVFTEEESSRAPDVLRIEVSRSPGARPEGAVIWQILPEESGYSLQMTTHLVGASICLAGCFAGLITSPLGDCLKKAKTRKEARDCITKHSFWSAVGSLSCVYGCLNI